MTIIRHPEYKNPVTLNLFQGLMSVLGIAYQQLRFRPAQRGSQTHSGSRIRYGLRALRQAPRLPLSHFAHQSARLRSLSAVVPTNS